MQNSFHWELNQCELVTPTVGSDSEDFDVDSSGYRTSTYFVSDCGERECHGVYSLSLSFSESPFERSDGVEVNYPSENEPPISGAKTCLIQI